MTNESDVKLRECPFCGEHLKKFHDAGFSPYYSHSAATDCPFDLQLRERDFNDWNTRASDHLLELAAEALRFYADMSKYPAPFTGGMGELYFDCGEKAKQTLHTLQQHLRKE